MNDDYQEFSKLVKKHIGLDLSLYKEAQMKRRITTLRNKRSFESFASYFEALKKDEVLMKEFTDRLTINVSEFYRNAKRWQVLTDKIFPEIAKGKKKVEIWSAACSTGEEPYSLAIMMEENFPNIDYRITATDIDDNVLEKAKQGVYMEAALKELPRAYRDKYFTRTGSLYKVDPKLGRHITFKKHNLLADRYPANIDLLVCRNVLIYFTDAAKTQIYQGFSSSLNEGGALFVGSTEQIFNASAYHLQLMDTFFYKKI